MVLSSSDANKIIELTNGPAKKEIEHVMKAIDKLIRLAATLKSKKIHFDYSLYLINRPGSIDIVCSNLYKKGYVVKTNKKKALLLIMW